MKTVYGKRMEEIDSIMMAMPMRLRAVISTAGLFLREESQLSCSHRTKSYAAADFSMAFM